MPLQTLHYCLIALILASAGPSLAHTKTPKGSPQVRILKDSSESTAERNRRLWRECKGRTNAGACAGYTR